MINKFDKIEVPLLDTRINKPDTSSGGSINVNVPRGTFMGIAQHDAQAGDIIRCYTNGQFMVSGT